jgi:O-antigen ligase
MRVKPSGQPINAIRLGSIWVESTVAHDTFLPGVSAWTLFFTAIAATLSIGFRDPRSDYLYEAVLFVLAAFRCWHWRGPAMGGPLPLALAAIPAWGFFQLKLGATEYPFVTLQSSLRWAALSATAWIGYLTFNSRRSRLEFLRCFAWFGAMVAVASVLGYFTSPGKLLWIFDAPYPDIWGPFLSRNHFAQFLELAMPVALWLGLRESKGRLLYLGFGALMLASGLASASRAGAAILALEALLILGLCHTSVTRKVVLGLLVATVSFAALPGVGNLAARLAEPHPYQGRREIAESALAMIRSRPWTGFGLGTFPIVYPEYALFDPGKSVEHAHNDWLEWAAEGGIPFAAAWMVLPIWSIRTALHSGWAIGIVGCFAHGLVDYPFARIGIAAWVFLLLGILAAENRAAENLPAGGLRKVRRPGH